MAPIKKEKPVLGKTFLKEWRVYARLSQEEAASQIGISRSTLSKIETRDIPYQQQHIEAAARIYECTVGDLLERDPTDNHSLESLISLLKKLNSAELMYVRGAIEALRRSSPSTQGQY